MTQKLQVDVVIIGAGPAGLMAATWMARTGIKTLIVDQKLSHTSTGRADGLEARTLEILDSFGLANQIWAQSNHTMEIALWCDSSDGLLQRRKISANTKPGWSRFHESTLGQARIEKHLLQFLQAHEHVEVRWGTMPKTIDVDFSLVDDPSAYPIDITLDRAPTTFPPDTVDRGQARTNGSDHRPDSALSHDSTYSDFEGEVQAKYLLGCDGAHSWVRKQLGLRLEGENLGRDWAAIDFVPATNFPDIRRRCVIKSRFGNMMYIPREKKLVRAYVQISPTAAEKYKTQPDAQAIMSQIETIMQPYHITAANIEWSTTYKIGQRVCPKFSCYDRIFLAGDAVHTHSPKAGQGMNVSMQDSYNLGWKIASVIYKVSPSSILRTYQQERYPVAERLLRLDKRVCRGLCGDISETNAHFDTDYQRALEEENTSCSGLAVTYRPNALVTPVECQGDTISLFSKPGLATGIRVGCRIPSDVVLNHSDSQAWHIQEIFPSVGQWNLVVFGGDISNPVQMRRVQELGDFLASDSSYIAKLNSSRKPGNLVGSVGIYLIHSAHRHDVDLLQLPEVYRSCIEQEGINYDKVFADNKSYHSGGGEAYAMLGISSHGCIVLLRPDQHVSFVGNLDDVHALEIFVATFLRYNPDGHCLDGGN